MGVIMIEIRQTSKDDLKNIQKLWADKEVMAHVGIPDGIIRSDDQMNSWLVAQISKKANSKHYSIYKDGKYCGEVHYEIFTDHDNIADLGIKLYSFARGCGIANYALSFVIDKAYKNGAKIISLDPNPNNKRAIRFYEKMGFVKKEAPYFVIKRFPQFDHYYMELNKKL